MTGGVRSLRRTDAGRFAIASTAGAIAALLLFAAVVTRGTFDLFAWQRSGNFYDAQADSWLDGTWEVSGGILGIERWEARGNTYMYQGPWPAVLRVPAMAVTDRLEGRMTQTSMLLGAAVALAAAAHLHWRVRRLVRGDGEPVTRADLVAAGAVTFAIGAGSALLYEASRAWVYHEAAVWGTAWSIAAVDAAIGCALHPARRRFAWAALCTALALCSRSSVGLAGVAAMGLLAGGNLLARVLRDRPSGGRAARAIAALRGLGTAPRPDGSRPVVAPAAAGLLPLGLYAAINWIKFRTLFSIPFWGQGFTLADPQRRAFLRENDGTLFGLKFSPTTFVQYLRPDGIDVTRTFPFVDFPPRADGIGGVTFDLIDHTSSIPASMPALFLLACAGAVVLLRRRGLAEGTGVAALRAPALGAIGGALTIIPFGYIANRYLADALPALVLLALVGLHVLLPRSAAAEPRRWRRPALAALGMLVVVGVWVNLAHALIFQRLHSPNVKDDVIAGFLDTQYDVGQSLGLDPRIPLRDDEELPLDAPRGQLVIIGDCEAMYLSDGMPLNGVKRTPWNAVMRTEAAGRYLRRATFPIQPPGTRVPLWTMTSGDRNGALTAEWQGGAGIVFDYDGPGHAYASPTLFVSPDEVFNMELVVDPRVDVLQLWLDGEMIFEDFYAGADDATIHPGIDALDDPAIADAFPGRFEPLPERTAPCAELRREAAEG